MQIKLGVLARTLALRTTVSIFLIGMYLFSSNIISLYVMLFFAIWSLFYYKLGGLSSHLVGLLLGIHTTWMLILLVVHAFVLSPVSETVIRSSVLKESNISILLFCSALFLYILTSILKVNYPHRELCFKDHFFVRKVIFVLIVVVSFSINSGGTIFTNVYEGNQGSYWSGLPLIFVLLVTSWLLLQKKFGIAFLITLNSIILFWLLHGNRSEVLLLFVFGNYLYLSKIKYFLNKKSLLFVFIAIIAPVTYVLFSFIGLEREGLSAGGDVIRDGRLHIQTFGSSIYSGIVAVEAVNMDGFLFGKSYLELLLNSIPSFVPVPWERYQDVSEKYLEFEILGGFGLIGEAYINFGLFGPLIIGLFIVSILNIFLEKASSNWFYSFSLLSFILYSQRYFLYGTVYLSKILLFLIVMYITYRLISVKKI